MLDLKTFIPRFTIEFPIYKRLSFLAFWKNKSSIFFKSKFTMDDDSENERILSELATLTAWLPKSGVSLIFAYGSGVLPQIGRDPKQNMVDLVFVVDNARSWHAENLKRNPRHYSFMRFLGAGRIAYYQTQYPARVYYNTLVRVGERYIKYGVIETKHLITDLLDWEHLYISGRLHKPVYFYISTPSTDGSDTSAAIATAADISASNLGSSSVFLPAALRTNLESACHAALLLSPEQMSWEEFCIRICSLSYNGDFRQTIGEDKNKVRNIVRANSDRFSRLYSPILKRMEKQVHVGVGGNVSQDLSAPAVHHHLEMLPKHVQWNLQSQWNKRDGKVRDIEEVIFQLAYSFDFPRYVDQALRSIVFRSSVQQTLKNVLSAGVRKSIVYSLAKLGKMIKSMR